MPLCETLDKMPIADVRPVVSPTGNYLAIVTQIDYNDKTLKIYNLNTCSIVYSGSTEIISNDLFFTDEDTLWQKTSVGYSPINLNADIGTLLENAQTLLSRQRVVSLD